MTRPLLLEQIATHISAIPCPHPLRVAIDGVDSAGKTTFADELVEPLGRAGRQVIRISLDGFHRPRQMRYQRGLDSAEGYFFDSFDYETLKQSVLNPLGPGGSRRYRAAAFDFRADAVVDSPEYQAQPDSILLFDGVFLLRPELAGCWEFTIYLDVDFEVAVARACRRDRQLFGSAEDAEKRYWKRYVPGQRIYLKTCQPQRQADLIIDNNELTKPRIR